MNHCVSTFKSLKLDDKINDEFASAIVKDLNFQTSTFNLFKTHNDCESYYNFLNELKKLHTKVESGDLSDFTE